MKRVALYTAVMCAATFAVTYGVQDVSTPSPDVGYDFTDSYVEYLTPAYDKGVYGSDLKYDNTFTNSPIEPACK